MLQVCARDFLLYIYSDQLLQYLWKSRGRMSSVGKLAKFVSLSWEQLSPTQNLSSTSYASQDAVILTLCCFYEVVHISAKLCCHIGNHYWYVQFSKWPKRIYLYCDCSWGIEVVWWMQNLQIFTYLFNGLESMAVQECQYFVNDFRDLSAS